MRASRTNGAFVCGARLRSCMSTAMGSLPASAATPNARVVCVARKRLGGPQNKRSAERRGGWRECSGSMRQVYMR